jgi:hypothetical protein
MWGELRAEADSIFNKLYDGLVNGIPEKELVVKKVTVQSSAGDSENRRNEGAFARGFSLK